jgi:hypothetical protein
MFRGRDFGGIEGKKVPSGVQEKFFEWALETLTPAMNIEGD